MENDKTDLSINKELKPIAITFINSLFDIRYWIFAFTLFLAILIYSLIFFNVDNFFKDFALFIVMGIILFCTILNNIIFKNDPNKREHLSNLTPLIILSVIIFPFIFDHYIYNYKYPLHCAVYKNNISEIISLIDTNININEKDRNTKTALMEASLKGYATVVNMLLVKGANVNATDKTGWSPLLYALVRNQDKIITPLINYGADVNQATSEGLTPLMIAARYSTVDSCNLLIKKGATLNDKNIQGQTALKIAKINERSEIVEFLVKNGAKE